MAVIVNGDGILTGISSLATSLTDITSGRGTITGVTTVGTLQLGAGVSISSPRSQNAAIFTNNSEFLTVDDAGRVGVGTISPNTDAHPQNVGKINVGFITARSVAGDIDANTLVVAGLSTFTGVIDANGGVTGNVTGNVTGTASGNAVLTGSTDNQLVTVTGANAIQGESNLTWDGSLLVVDRGSSNGTAIQVRNDDDTAYSTSAEGHLNTGLSLQSTTPGGQNDQSVALQFNLGLSGQTGVINEIGAVRTGSGQGDLIFRTRNSSTGRVERLRITSAGNVGIGELAPANLLHVKVSDTGVAPHASAQIVLERSGTNYLQFLTAADGTSGLLFGDANDNDVGKLVYDHNVTEMQFNTETAQAMKITGGGVVQIGGNIANNADLDTANTKLTIKQSANAQEDGIYIERSGERRGFYMYMGGALGVSDGLCFTTNQLGGDTHILAMDRGGDVKIGAGSLILSSAGEGIDFSATGDGNGTDSSELLADYEEGTWTPTNTIGLTLVVHNQAYYTKVGKLVTVWFDISFRGYADSAQCSQIQGLPYAASSSTQYHAQSNSVWYSNTNNDKRDYDDENTLIYINGGDSTIRMWNVVSGHIRVRSWAVVDANTGRRFRGTMSYLSD